MDSLTLIRSRLGSATRPELKAVAEFTGIPFHTLRKIVDGETQNPRFNTIEPLRKYVESIPSKVAA
jgi:predicted transcriptional regulator